MFVGSAMVADDKPVCSLTAELFAQLPDEGLRHVFLLSEGLGVNGSELMRGMNHRGGSFTISGGMASSSASPRPTAPPRAATAEPGSA